ncbi:MAG: hypothetical protein ACE5J5_02545 [Candidatus Hydrothermarchaeales archaeon]
MSSKDDPAKEEKVEDKAEEAVEDEKKTKLRFGTGRRNLWEAILSQ